MESKTQMLDGVTGPLAASFDTNTNAQDIKGARDLRYSIVTLIVPRSM